MFEAALRDHRAEWEEEEEEEEGGGSALMFNLVVSQRLVFTMQGKELLATLATSYAKSCVNLNTGLPPPPPSDSN